MRLSLPLTRFLKDRGGNFGIMTAILTPLALGAGGMAIDITQAIQVKGELQALADSASLAAARAMSEGGKSPAEARELAEKLYAAQMVNYLKTGNETDAEIDAMIAQQRAALRVSISETNTGTRAKSYSISVGTTYQMPVNAMTGLLTGNTMTLAASSTAVSATESTNGISMYLALDRSGSMSWVTSTKDTTRNKCDNYTKAKWPNVASTQPCYISKIAALKTAANAMFAALNKADPKTTLVRVGASAYTHETFAVSPIAWGTTAAAKYVSAIPAVPEGGTDANSSMTAAINALKSSHATENNRTKATEENLQKEKGNGSVSRYIVLMTDGEMTGNSANFNNSLDKSVRTKCETAKKDGIQIFTVAFMAPDTGKSLLSYCASASDYYYEPEDMEDLVKAFGEIAEKAAKATTRLTN
ncbi:vWA domain-containing protein [Neorhizobium sp. NPDC001467]|uniref:vWA domain-containing protein n=1 Tax=Neorhizobium sp. NPDC001467 TaxID=3390595 RepID=UPI003CFEE894